MTTVSLDMLQAMERSAALAEKNFPALALMPLRPRISHEERLQAAEQLRERLSGVPFYAARAARARAAGDEMVYWLSLQSTQATAHRR